jgi:hypothetical protein
VAVKAQIISGTGKARGVGVTADHALMVDTLPPRRANLAPGLLTARKLYREWFTTLAGSGEMNVLGSGAAPIKFLIDSKSDRCLSVTQIRLLIDSSLMNIRTASSEVRRFGAAAVAPGLTNGLTLVAIQEGVQTPIFLDPVRNIGDFFLYTDQYLAFEDGANTNVDILAVTITFEVPVILPAGSTDRLEFQVRDNLTALSYFRTLALGDQELRLTEE